jgi:hypothetical protein
MVSEYLMELIYKGRPIFRQFGGFSYQGLQGEGAYDPLVWEGLLGMLTIEDGYIRSIEIIPLELNEGNEKEYGDAIEFREKRGFSDVATGPMAAKILNRFKDLSAKYDTSVKIKGEKAIIEIQSSPASKIIKNEKPSLIPKGVSSFIYQNENLNTGRPITVYSYLPSNYKDSSPVLFVMHGSSRTAKKYRDDWINIAEQHNALLLVPHFSRENGFPVDDQYNMGNMFDMDSQENLLAPNPESEWSYSLIDPIFNYVVDKMKNKSSGYLIYGHSAGSQFLHRLIFFKPDAKIKKAVCANAGWYTMPDFEQVFPYGLKETQCTAAALRKVFAKKVTILLGDQDTDPNHRSLRRTPEAMKQGVHRFQRGHTFYEVCQQMAAELGVELNWDLQIVPGVAHSNSKMAPAAAEVLFK